MCSPIFINQRHMYLPITALAPCPAPRQKPRLESFDFVGDVCLWSFGTQGVYAPTKCQALSEVLEITSGNKAKIPHLCYSGWRGDSMKKYDK